MLGEKDIMLEFRKLVFGSQGADEMRVCSCGVAGVTEKEFIVNIKLILEVDVD